MNNELDFLFDYADNMHCVYIVLTRLWAEMQTKHGNDHCAGTIIQ